MNTVEMNKICWKAFNAGILSESETEILFDVFMPYKGSGNISVQKQDVEKAIDLLREWVGEYELDYVNPSEFIIDGDPSDWFYYGKFEIHNLSEFLRHLVDQGVKIKSVYFWEPTE